MCISQIITTYPISHLQFHSFPETRKLKRKVRLNEFGDTAVHGLAILFSWLLRRLKYFLLCKDFWKFLHLSSVFSSLQWASLVLDTRRPAEIMGFFKIVWKQRTIQIQMKELPLIFGHPRFPTGYQLLWLYAIFSGKHLAFLDSNVSLTPTKK